MSRFEAIYSGQDVDRIRAEHGQHAHKDVVQAADVQRGSNERPNYIWHYHCGRIEIHIINHEQRQRGDCGQQQFVPPLEVQHVICEAQEDHAADGQESGNIFDAFVVRKLLGIVKEISTKRDGNEQEQGDEEDTSCEYSQCFGARKKEGKLD